MGVPFHGETGEKQTRRHKPGKRTFATEPACLGEVGALPSAAVRDSPGCPCQSGGRVAPIRLKRVGGCWKVVLNQARVWFVETPSAGSETGGGGAKQSVQLSPDRPGERANRLSDRVQVPAVLEAGRRWSD